MTNDRLTRMVDAGLAGVVFLVPLALGGRGAVGEATLILLALGLSTGWCLRQTLARQPDWIRSAATPILLAAVALIVVQLIPWPPALLARLSPHLKEILPLWSPPADGTNLLGTWQTLSLEPELTRSCLILVGSFALIFLVAVQRIRSVEDVESLLRLIAIATIVMATFGLVQLLAGNGRFFWFYEDPYSDTRDVVKGSFICRNHFAHFIVLGIGPVLWWLFDALTGSRRSTRNCRSSSPHRESVGGSLAGVLRLVALAVCALTVLLSLSRGGFITLCIATAISVAILYRAEVINRKAILGSAAVAAMLIAIAVPVGYTHVADRLDTILAMQSDTLQGNQGRAGIWRAGFQTIADYSICGTGLGTHREVHKMYMDQVRFDYTHAENGYIQVALEAGLPGFFLACSALALYSFWCVGLAQRSQDRRTLLALAAIAPAVAATTVHSLFDFVWYIPGCMVPLVLLAACACRLWQIDRQEDRTASLRSPAAAPTPRILWMAATVCLLLLATATLPATLSAIPAERSWHRYLVQSRTSVGEKDSARIRACQEMLEAASLVVKWQPRHSRAHVRLAALHLELFERLQSEADPPFGVAQIRDAALASQFSSSAALQQWLGRVAGGNLVHLHEAWTHARRAVTLCPLHGTAYLLLAKLSFLEGSRSPGKTAYVAQALKTQPLDGAVQFEAGLESVLAGRMDDAMAHWRISFQSDSESQTRLLESLARQMPAAVFVEQFEPDLAGLRRVAAHYAKLGRKDELPEIRSRLAQALVAAAQSSKGREAAGLWREAGGVYHTMDAEEYHIRCLQQAVVHDPSWFDVRLQLAKILLEDEQWADAEKELLACRRQRPYDQSVQGLLEQVVDQRLRLTGRVSDSRK